MNITTFEEIKLTGNLPSPAGVGVRILELTRNEEYSVEEMGHAIMADSSLTGRILQLANTGERTGSLPATTVSESIMRLGSRTVRNLALAFSIVSERTTGACRTFQYETYWSGSLGRAVAAQAVSRRLGQQRSEESYICGLLSDVGRLALASVYAESYGAMLAEHGPRPLEDLIEKENKRFKIDHAQVSSLMLTDWGLPTQFTEAAFEYGTKRSIRSIKTIQGLGDVLRIAYWISEALVGDEYTEPYTWKMIGEELEHARGLLSMNPGQWESFCDAIAKDWVHWGDTLEVNTGNGQRFSEVARYVAASKDAKLGDPVSSLQPVEDAAPLPKSQTDQATEKNRRSSDQVRIMVVGSHAVTEVHKCQGLDDGTFEVRETEAGEDGLRAILRWGADIILVDETASGLSGLEICKSLRRNEQSEGLYILVVGTPGSKGHGLKAFAAGADDFIELPTQPEVLEARIRAGLRVCALQRRVEKDKATVMRQVAELGVLTRKLRSTALTDSLTNLPNRRYAIKRLESEWSSMLRTGKDMSLVMLDVDHFKSVNDNHGHDVGDVVLTETAKILKTAIRTSDEACRIGGEEFVIICKNTKEADCLVVAERIRTALEAHRIQAGSFDGHVTVSLGIAGNLPTMKGPAELLKRADEAVYEAKRLGRNQSVLASQITPLRKSA
ncbi:MAG: diguanylate cyclase [Planctomycetes bacterium]|nr:diguanylate cyclase [Planctomycetota bacterium]MCB9909692.1 diguanylate cyclase [Planctomycetota bacterium]MCB9911819.1 diguanylate cyclase [Planctomycetota bacterium]